MLEAIDAAPNDRRWRRFAFTAAAVIGALVCLVLVGSAFAAFSPWLPKGGDGPPPGYADPTSHRWHDAQWAAHTGILFGGSVIALLWRPARKPLLVQFLAIATVVFLAFFLPVNGPETLVVVIPIALVVALFPDRRALLDSAPVGGLDVPLLALAVAVALAMAPDAWDTLRLQIDPISGDEHAAHNHWSLTSLLLVNLLLAGGLSATRRPGWRTLGALTGLASLYLGAVVLTSRDWVAGVEPLGLWSTAGGVLALLAGLAYLGSTLPRDVRITQPGRLIGSPRTVESGPSGTGD